MQQFWYGRMHISYIFEFIKKSLFEKGSGSILKRETEEKKRKEKETR